MLTAANTARFGATAAPRSRLGARSVLRPPRSLVVVAFQEPERSKAEKVVREQEQQLADDAAARDPTDVPAAPAKSSSLKDRSIRKTRDAIDSLLGRAHDSSTSSSAATPPAKRSAPGSLAPHTPAFQAPLSLPVFSRRREVFAGRAAMIGFQATCGLEVVTHVGPMSQLSQATGLPPLLVQGLLGALVLHGLVGLAPFTPTWSPDNRNDLTRRERGFPRALINPIREPARFFGFSEWGFTKRNEVFAGRLAMLGWSGVALLEPLTGNRGPLGQIAWWLHLPTPNAFYELCNTLLVVLPLVFGVVAYIRKKPGQLRGGDDVY